MGLEFPFHKQVSVIHYRMGEKKLKDVLKTKQDKNKQKSYR